MKNLLVILLVFGTYHVASAQSPSSIKEKMKPFENWSGDWSGESAVRMGPGEPKKAIVNEHIESKLDGTIIVVEGIGKSKDESGKEFIAHHAFGVLAYDQANNKYKFNTYLKDGKMADAWFNVVGDNQYQWGFDSPQGKIRYKITLNPEKKTWNEMGEFSNDGNTWYPFFEMNLTRAN